MKSVFSVISSPIGPLQLVAEEGALRGVYLAGPHDPVSPAGEERPEEPVLLETARQLDEYFSGQRLEFDLPLRLQGTSFQVAAWRALLDIPFGQTRSYAEQARALGRPSAIRAVGGANGRNPISIVVPCHRVVGSDGRLTGYAGGLPVKRWLLEHEARVTGRASIAPAGQLRIFPALA